MTPGARVAAAAEVLDLCQGGVPAEKALTNWARGHRFAGSKDRAAIRDHVFDVLRQRRSSEALGGGDTGRALMIGVMRAMHADPAEVFTGEGYGPAKLTDDELNVPQNMTQLEALDCPDWLAPKLQAALGEDFEAVMRRQQHRAPLFLRVNSRRNSRADAIAALAQSDIKAEAHRLSDTALVVTDGARKVKHCDAYLDGLVEIQDAASQAVCDLIQIPSSENVLDFCAGGGGKTLALSARCDAAFYAFDDDAGRMVDLPVRAKRAGVSVQTLDRQDLKRHAPYDVVVTDVPCSGSGTWARQPDAKWRFTPERLSELCNLQADILEEARLLCSPTGRLIYITCSLLQEENEHQVKGFLDRHAEWNVKIEQRITPISGGDGLFIAILSR